MDNSGETVTALLTGEGRGAIATVVVDGPRAAEFVARFFRPAERPAFRPRPNAILFGEWRWQGRCEELVVCLTAADRIEVHCHGGRWASRQILDSLIAAGAAELSSWSWLRRCGHSQSVADAHQLLAAAKTERTAAILLDQLRGALRRELQALTKLLESNMEAGQSKLRRLIDHGDVGLHLATPWSVVLVGRPNAGKSSLINCLLGYDRAVVFDQPGTTRDLVSAETAIDGWPVRLTDTAGIREPCDPIENEGIRLAELELATADLVLVVNDLTEPPTEIVELATARHRRILRVATKADLVPDDPGGDQIRTSSVTGEGIETLLRAIAASLVPHAPSAGDGVPLSVNTVARLQLALQVLKAGNVERAVGLLGDELDR